MRSQRSEATARPWLAAAVLVLAATSAGCVCVDCRTIRHVDGTLVDPAGRAVDAWVGLTDRPVDPNRHFGRIANRHERGDPNETWSGLTHTDREGHFNLEASGPGWGYTLIFGFIPSPPFGNIPPEVPVIDFAYLNIHDAQGWRSVRLDLRPDQQARHEPGERWVKLDKVVIPQATPAEQGRPSDSPMPGSSRRAGRGP